MDQPLQEYVDSRGVELSIDTQAGVLRGVKILGLRSRNGRRYLADALSGAAALYEGAKVNVNHPKGSPLAPRDYQDRIGMVREVTFRPGLGLFADFHFNPKHPLAEQLLWDARHAPHNVGFSHNVQARTTQQNGTVTVEAITSVQSVDLVADPATTRGLFESADGDEASGGETFAATENKALAELTLEELTAQRPDLVEALRSRSFTEQRQLQRELDRLRVLEATHQRRKLAASLLAEFGLPGPQPQDKWARAIVSESFLQTLLAAPDEAAMRSLVEERAQLVNSARRFETPSHGHSRPVSRDALAAGVDDAVSTSSRRPTAAQFAKAIT